MSKFLNEPKGAQHLEGVAAAPAPEGGAGNPALASENGLGRLLKPFQESSASAKPALSRLESCRLICLPRTWEKSFLVTQYNPAMQAAVEAYRTLRTRLTKRQTASGARSLVVSSAVHGEGKTLTVLNLCLCCSQIPDWPVLAVDADLRTRGMSKLLNETDSPGVATILAGAREPAAAVLRTDVQGLYFLPAGYSIQSPAELFSGEAWKKFMVWASETFRLVIVDSPPALMVSDFDLILAHCESAMLVVRARKGTGESLTQALAQIDPGKLAGVVFNAGEEISNQGYGAMSMGARQMAKADHNA